MTKELLSELLKDLLRENSRIYVPGMGSFFAEIMPAVIVDGGNTINPPYKKVYFRSNETWNDGLLERSYAQKSSLEIEVSKEKIERFVREFKKELNAKKSVDLPGMGIMRATNEKSYFFVADDDLDLYSDAFGLEPISLKRILYSSDRERAPERGATVTEKRDDRKDESREPVIIQRRERDSDDIDDDQEREGRRLGRTGIILICVAAAILLIAVAIFLLIYFDSPILDKLLYTKEELRLLRGR